jgi:protein-disulfide isomerase
MTKGSAIVAIIFAFVTGIAVGYVTSNVVTKQQQAASEAEDRAIDTASAEGGTIDRYRVPVTDAQPIKGAKDALVTIVQVSDFQCPFCKRVEPTIDQLLKDYPTKLRVVWRNNPLPFHDNATPAAEAAVEAKAQGGDKKFWKMHGLLFENQQKLSRADLENYAKEAGLNVEKFKKALDTHAHKSAIEADTAVAAKLGARGTPAFFINGRYLSGAQPVEQFKTIIDDEIKRAEKLIAAGVSKKGIYLALTKKGLTEAKAEEAQKPQQPRRRPDPNAVYKVPVGSSPQKGPSDALITLIEFADYQCPFCTRVVPTIEKIQSTYGRDVRFVFKQNPLPFHQNAMPASQAALAAGAQGKFWQMHEKLFQNQQALTRPDLEKYAKELGLNMAKFNKAMDENTFKAEIEDDQKLARSIGASGTPSFFINGRNLRGAQPFEAFKAVIDEELAKAKALLAKGTPRGKVYDALTADGATAPKFIDLPGGDAPSAPARPAEPPPDRVYQIPVPPSAPRKGARNGKVMIQQFSDYQCPFCSRVEPTVDQIVKQYGDKVTIVWRNFPLPFHPFAKPAAEASVEVYAQGGAEKFWKYHGLLFANQQALSRADLEKYAEQVGGINMARFKKALDTGANTAAVEADIEAVNKAGAQIGTPSFFINGKLLQGAQPFEAFKQAIDAALSGK